MQSLAQLGRDLAFGFRMLARRPAFTAAAVLSLVLGIGLNTAIFTLLDAIFLRPLPVRDMETLAAVYVTVRDDETGEYGGLYPHSYPNYLDLVDRNRSFDGLALHIWWPMNFTGGSEPIRGTGTFVTANYFDVLGLSPAAGRFFLPQEAATPGAEPVTVLSYSSWQRLFGGADVVGREVRINGRTFTVVGVAPRDFKGLLVGIAVDFFVPITMFPEISPYGSLFEVRGPAIFQAVGRLREGVSPARADDEMMRLMRRLEDEHPDQNDLLGGAARPLLEATLQPGERGQRLDQGRILAGAVALILLMSCVNVASLLLLRGTERGGEIAVRQSLGASRGRIVAQLVSENLLLFVVAGVLSLPAGRWFLGLLWRFRPPQFAADALTLRLDGPVFAFTLATALAAGLVFGLLPALRASRPHLVAHLKETSLPEAFGRRTKWLRLRRLLAVAQVALALVSLIAAGLGLASLRNSRRVDLGFDAESLLVVSFAPGEQGFDAARTRTLYRQVLERVEALPGVESAALSQNRLLRGSTLQLPIYREGEEAPLQCGGRNIHRVNAVSPGFFATAGIPLLQGRDFDESVRADGPRLAIVNQTMAELLWPDQDAVGRRFLLRETEERVPIEVAGVARDVKYRHVREAPQCFLYLPEAQRNASAMTLHVRTAGDPARLLGAVRDEIAALAPGLPLADAKPLREFVEEDLWVERVSAMLLSAFGVLALILATVGVYGVLARTVSQRRREMGIRMAIGARRADVLRAVFAEGLALVGAGVAVGLAAAAAAMKLSTSLSSQLQGVRATDPAIYAGAAAVLFAVACAGFLLPALKAARTDPARALRVE